MSESQRMNIGMRMSNASALFTSNGPPSIKGPRVWRSA